VSSFTPSTKIGYNFTLENFEGNELQYKISASNIRWVDKDSTYRLSGYIKRVVGENDDIIIKENRKDTIFDFDLNDLTPVSYAAATEERFELNECIQQKRDNGAPNINTCLVVKYIRWSLPVSAFIITIVAASVSSMKRRAARGLNLAIGISLA